MKFSKTMKHGLWPDWADHYIDYKALKKTAKAVGLAKHYSRSMARIGFALGTSTEKLRIDVDGYGRPVCLMLMGATIITISFTEAGVAYVAPTAVMTVAPGALTHVQTFAESLRTGNKMLIDMMASEVKKVTDFLAVEILTEMVKIHDFLLHTRFLNSKTFGSSAAELQQLIVHMIRDCTTSAVPPRHDIGETTSPHIARYECPICGCGASSVPEIVDHLVHEHLAKSLLEMSVKEKEFCRVGVHYRRLDIPFQGDVLECQRYVRLRLYQLRRLMDFIDLNITASRKLVKKINKKGYQNIQTVIEHEPHSTCCERWRSAVKNIHDSFACMIAEAIAPGNERAGMKALNLQSEMEKIKVDGIVASQVQSLAFGCFVLAGLLIIELVVYWPSDIDPPRVHDTANALMLWIAQPLLMYCLVGVNMALWSKTGINYMFIFGIDPTQRLSDKFVLRNGLICFFMWFLSLMLFKRAEISFMQSGSVLPDSNLECLGYFICNMPYIFFAVLLIFLIRKATRRTDDHWLRDALLKQLTPWREVSFVDIFVGDALTTLTFTMVQTQFIMCQWSSDICHSSLNFPAVAIVPNAIRIVQCVRRLKDTKALHGKVDRRQFWNALKYFSTVLAIVIQMVYTWRPTNRALYFWLVFNFISSVYKCVWDLYIDWSVFGKRFNLHSAKKKGWYSYGFGLRKKRIYPVWAYYYAISSNILLRFLWIPLIWVRSSSQTQSSIVLDMLTFVPPILEVFRRFVWNFFRVENEQINNCDRFRVIRTDWAIPRVKSPEVGTPNLLRTRSGFPIRHHPSSPLNGGWCSPLGSDEKMLHQTIRTQSAANLGESDNQSSEVI